MGGRASLILVMGFSLILGYISFNLNQYSTRAVGNMSNYAETTTSHNLALAGANVGLAKFYTDTSWAGTLSQDVAGPNLTGSFTISRTNVGSNSARLRSVSTYTSYGVGTLHDTVDILFDKSKLNSFSMFAWMTNIENGVYWITGDTVWGRAHSNSTFYVSGRPVYMDKVTTTNSFSPKPGVGTNQAIFKKGYETGIAPITLPSDMTELVTASTSGGKKYTGDIWVTLDPGTSSTGDGKAYIRSTSSGPIIDSISLGNASFNGVLLGTGRVNVKGTLDGKLSIGSMTDVYIQDDIRYAKNPQTSASDDILGLVANRDVVVADNAANNHSVYVDGCVFARSGSFRAENYDSRPVAGTLNILGSIVQNTRGAVGTFSGSTLVSGFSKRYRYDARLADATFRPPSYPGFFVKTFAITSWWESYRVLSSK
jgi:hypothetical protein